jgi:2-methylaconitate cis-trans-isomerase PrpF
MQTRADLYKYLRYHAYEVKLDGVTFPAAEVQLEFRDERHVAGGRASHSD